MPKLQAKLVSRGLTFRNSFVTDPLCCPSRATILRGQYVHNHGVETNTRPEGGGYRFWQLGRDRSTVATWLQDSGYCTALIGKYLNAYKGTYIPPGWDRWFATVGQATEHRFNDQGKRAQHSSEHLYEDIIAERAIEWLDRIALEQDPFFLYLAPHAPHQPATPAPRHADQFSDKRLPRPPNFNEQDVSDKPSWLRDKEPLRQAQIRESRELYRNRLRALLGVDDLIGQLVDALQSMGKLDNSYIFYTSDHGFHLGEHRQESGKRSPYEEDIRVPLVCRGPGVPWGETRDHLTINNDFAPTLAELAGANIPSFIDGRSMVPLLGNAPPAVGDYRQRFLFGQVKSRTTRGLSSIPTYLGVRTLRHSYVEYESGEKELYDIQADPYQLNNVPDIGRKKLYHYYIVKQLASLRECGGDRCRAAEEDRSLWWGRIFTGG
jgi:N-acetylglucosamine-6-sulfatase